MPWCCVARAAQPPARLPPGCLAALQGEAEGLEASPAIYQGLIQHLCSEGTPDVAASVLALMQVG